MSTTSRPPVPIAMGTSDTGSEEARAFHQDRLALFGQWICLVSGAFLAFFTGLRLLLGYPVVPASGFHALATTLAGGIWAIGARGRHSIRAMEWTEVIGTWLVCTGFALMTWGYGLAMSTLGLDPASTIYIGLLATGYTVMARAIAMPSQASRTAWVGAGAMLPLAVAVFVVLSTSTTSRQPLTMALVDAGAWMVAAVAMSVVASRVIFGLRAEVNAKRRLGQYTLEEKIGEGGMGVVYRAHHAMLRRPTAVKLLPPDKAGADNIQRFEREVQLTASLTHPNTVAIFDYGRTVEGVFYYAMEFLDGMSLDALVKADGPQPPGRVIRILAQVSGALAEAHGIGLVHRDVKPANIILCERGGIPDVAKVVDFGLVKRFRADDTAATVAAITVETSLLGTPHYMAPEAVTASSDLDARSDLYSLGAVGYFLLTGTPVFGGKSIVEICAHHLHTPPEPPSRRLGRPLPPPLERLVLQCLAKSADDRPPSAQALRRDLMAALAAEPWSDDDAARWWARRRQVSQPPARGTIAPDAAHALIRATD